jgi:adenosylmethionine-8-amino-7-oxononanoate aminotransferase
MTCDSTPDCDLRERIVALDKRYVWHPYTEMRQWISEAEPLVIGKASGSKLYDLNGRCYIDGNASWWTSLLGHNHPRLVQALKRQADELCHCALAGITHEPAARLAEELIAVAPRNLSRVFFSDDGSTAIEVAVKMAVQYWRQVGRPKRYRFVALEGAFHGETLAPTALGGVPEFRRPFDNIVMDVIHVPVSEGAEQAHHHLCDVLRRESDTLAGVVVEPILQGCAGMRIHPPSYLSQIRQLTRELGILLIADEVFTGYGRTGPFWACELAGVEPDILCTAKGFSGGMLPMAATLVTDEVFQGFMGEKSRAFYYGHTFCGNPLGAAVAREVLATYRDEHILEKARPKSTRIASALNTLAGSPGIRDVRSIGMVGAVELADDLSGYFADAGWRVARKALERGVYIRPLGNLVYIAPALNIPDPDLEELLTVVVDCVRSTGMSELGR